MHQMTQRAINAIGHTDRSDWHLVPERHAGTLPDEAGPLKRILVTRAVQDIIDEYTRHDKAAGPAQKKELRWTTMLLWLPILLIALGVVFAGVPVGRMFGVRIEVFLLSLLGAFYLLTIFLRYLGEIRNLQTGWILERGKAERARRDLFEKIFDTPAVAGEGEIAALPLKLEYFRRYQLDVQKAYYEGRADQLLKEARAWENKLFAFRVVGDVGLIMVTLALLATALGPAVEQRPAWVAMQWVSSVLMDRTETSLAVAIAVLIVLVTAFSMGFVAQTNVNRKKVNAFRYEATRKNLEQIEQLGLQAARDAAVEYEDGVGRPEIEPVRRFVSSIHQIMAGELAVWLQTDESRKTRRGSQAQQLAASG